MPVFAFFVAAATALMAANAANLPRRIIKETQRLMTEPGAPAKFLLERSLILLLQPLALAQLLMRTICAISMS